MLAAEATSFTWAADSSPERTACSSSGSFTTASAASSRERAFPSESPVSPASQLPASRCPSASNAPVEATRSAQRAFPAHERRSRREKKPTRIFASLPCKQGGIELGDKARQRRFERSSGLAHPPHLLTERMFVMLKVPGGCIGDGLGRRAGGWAGDDAGR